MEHGFEATGLRSITAAAGVNLAAVNYHFGTKEELFESVLTRRLDPMNQERLQLLDQLERDVAPLDAVHGLPFDALRIGDLHAVADERDHGVALLRVGKRRAETGERHENDCDETTHAFLSVYFD